MITVLVHELNQAPMRQLLSRSGRLLPHLRMETYQAAFRRLTFPRGTLIFTDFEFLNGVEIMAAAEIAETARRVDPSARVLNHPARALERFALLRRLNEMGMNSVEVSRLEQGERPSRYPVFIRMEDYSWGPETGLLETPEQLDGAISRFQASSRPMKRRIAVTFEGRRDAAGYYRKYGAFRIGGAVVPQHILRNMDWNVKSSTSSIDPDFVREELAFVQDNPHADALLRVCDAGHIQFGRVDYTVRDDSLVIFEVNPNPTFPRFKGGSADREERRGHIIAGLRSAFAAIDSAGEGRADFMPPAGSRRHIQSGRWMKPTRLLWKARFGRRMKMLAQAVVPGRRVGDEMEALDTHE
jgi:hypothetical protein